MKVSTAYKYPTFVEDYTKIRIGYSKDGKQDSLEFERGEDFSAKLFTKSERVILADGINQCEEKIHRQLVLKMLSLL